MTMDRIVLVLAVAFAAIGCNVTHEIGQNTTPAHRVHATPPHGELSVRPFVDQRAADVDNRTVLSAEDELEVRGETLCVNGEQKYEGRQVPAKVTRFLSRRIRERGAFKDVKVSGAGRYVLSGTLAAFYGRQEVSDSARVGMQFGLIGALATSGATTDGTVRVALRGLVLEDRTTNRRIPLADIEVTRQGELDAAASCMLIYQHVDDALSDAATRLAEAVELALAAPATPATPTNDVAFGEVTITAVYANASTPTVWQATEGAEVFINGRSAGTTPLHDGLPEGHYDIEVRYGGGTSQRYAIQAVPGQHQRIEARIVLPPSREELASAERERAARYEADHRAWQARTEERAPARRNLLIAAIATGVGGAAALTAGIVFKSSASDLDDQVQANHAAWLTATEGSARATLEDDIRALESDRDRNDLLGNIFAITGGAALVTSVVLLAIRPSALEEPAPVQLTVGADPSALLRVSGDF